MGNLSGKGLSVKYKATRGTHQPGDIINPLTDPKDWVEQLMKTDRDETVAMFNALTPEQQQQLEACFDEDGEAGVFGNVGNYEGWQGDADDDTYAEVYEKVSKVLASLQQ